MTTFTGDKKVPLKSPLAKIERRFIDAFTPRFPQWIQGYHLTLMTILWSAGLVVAGWLGREDLRWLFLASAMQALQWFTDSFDGSLGRYRDTGIPKWGYYMDHFLDYVFMSCALIGYALLLDGTPRFIMLLLLPIQVGFVVNSYLSFSSTGEFKITFLGIGPTELRLFMIGLNTAVTMWGTWWFGKTLPYAGIVLFCGLCVVVFRTQKYVWAIDMADKKARDQKNELGEI
jgi:archaetidylinositol phosphate synthase